MLQLNQFFFIVVVMIIVVVIVVVFVRGDSIGSNRGGSLERLALSALRAGQEIDDVAASVQASRPAVGEAFSDAVLTHNR